MNDRIESFAAAVVTELEAVADPVRAENETRYFKGTINSIGTTLPGLQKVEKQLCKGMENTWSVGEALELCDHLLEKRVFEVTLLALTMLERFAGQLGKKELLRFEQWLEADLLDNWAAVDTLCPHVVGSMLHERPELALHVRKWADSPNCWLRRASAVSFITLLRKGKFVDLAYEIAAVLFTDKENDLVQKGNGWMLREAGLADMDRLERFLLQHGPTIPRTTLRYAVEKFPKDRRLALMAATKLGR